MAPVWRVTSNWPRDVGRAIWKCGKCEEVRRSRSRSSRWQGKSCLNLLWQLWSQRGSDRKSEWSNAPTWRLSGERNAALGGCARVKRGEFSKTPGRGKWQHERELYLFSGERRSSWWIKGLSACSHGGASDEEGGQNEESCQVRGWLQRRGNQLIVLVTGRRGSGESSRVDLAVMRTSAYQRIGPSEWQYKRTRARREIWAMMGQLSKRTYDW